MAEMQQQPLLPQPRVHILIHRGEAERTNSKPTPPMMMTYFLQAVPPNALPTATNWGPSIQMLESYGRRHIQRVTYLFRVRPPLTLKGTTAHNFIIFMAV